MTILVFGSTGQVATELRAQEPGAIFLGRDRADLTDPGACAAVIREIHPDAVINAAAWTAVDKAEAEEAAATVVNGAAPAAMARAAAQLGVPFVQISTDYVFDGTGSAPFAPDHATAPLGAYGRSKLAGNRASSTPVASMRSCARRGCFRRMGRISSRRCCGSRKRATG